MSDASDRLRFPEPLAAALRDRSEPIVVTGGGGWIGQALLEMLDGAFPGDVFDQRVVVYGATDRRQTLRSSRVVAVHALDRIDRATHRVALYVHCAFLTKDRLSGTSTEDFVAANVAIGDRVETAMRRGGVAGLFVPSSGAVYRRGTHDLDDDLATNAYGVMKRRDEERFGTLAADLGVPASMPRVFNLAGPFINKIDLYAIASMIDQVLDGRPIAIRARHRVIRSYIHVGDLLSLALATLLDPKPGMDPVFDTRGAVDVELADLADQVRVALGRLDLAIERPPLDPTAPVDRYLGEPAALDRLRAVYAIPAMPFSAQIQDTAAYLAGRRTQVAA